MKRELCVKDGGKMVSVEEKKKFDIVGGKKKEN